METHLRDRATAYNKWLFKQWYIISISLITLAFALIIGLSARMLSCYSSLKKEVLALENILFTHKNDLIIARRLAREKKTLKKLLAHFIQSKKSEILKAISQSIPQHTHLTSLTIDKNLVLEGCSADLHEVTQFITRLAALGIVDGSLDRSCVVDNEVNFIIVAKPPS